MSVNSIIAHHVQGSVTAAEVLRAPMQEVAAGWSGVPLARPYRWTLVLDSQTLWFGVEFPKSRPEPARFELGSFVEWLAQQGDVAELFLMSQSGQYQEFHLTGEGAWWGMTFSGYRQRSVPAARPEGVVSFVDGTRDGWRGVLGIPRSEVVIPLDAGSLAQVSACLHVCDQVSYVSSAGSPSYEADFHDRRSFQPLVRVATVDSVVR